VFSFDTSDLDSLISVVTDDAGMLMSTPPPSSDIATHTCVCTVCDHTAAKYAELRALLLKIRDDAGGVLSKYNVAGATPSHGDVVEMANNNNVDEGTVSQSLPADLGEQIQAVDEDTPSAATYHVKIPAEDRWYWVTRGRETGVFQGWYVAQSLL
jgi:hypothetical protein